MFGLVLALVAVFGGLILSLRFALLSFSLCICSTRTLLVCVFVVSGVCVCVYLFRMRRVFLGSHKYTTNNTK